MPPWDQRNATGSSERPISVMTVPVTTGGKKRTSFEKYGVRTKPSRLATMMAPKMTVMPSAPRSLPMAIIGVTPAKETPLTNGSLAPTFEKPRV